MFPRGRTRIGTRIGALLIAGMMLLSIGGCRNRQPNGGEPDVEPTGEPETYSATVVRTIVEGSNSETFITRIVKSNEKVREEWSEEDRHRALIWRPDLGKSFLLDLDQREFQEIAGDSPGVSETGMGARAGLTPQRSPDLEEDRNIQTIDQHLDDAQSPASVETHMLSEVVIEGHRCSVYEERSSFLDGHTEVTRRFRARDLAGLVLKVETSMLPGGVTITTERRDVRTEASDDEFVVPADFKRVDVVR